MTFSQDIEIYPNKDSVTWKTIFKHKDDIADHRPCSREYQLTWGGAGNGNRIKNFNLRTRPSSRRDLGQEAHQILDLIMETDIGPPSHLQNAKTMEYVNPLHCAYCGEVEETIGHLFFNYSYSTYILIEVSSVKGHALWKKLNSPTPDLGVDVRARDIMDGIQSLRK